MTALTALDYFKLSDILTVKQATTEGSILGLYEGEQMSFEISCMQCFFLRQMMPLLQLLKIIQTGKYHLFKKWMKSKNF